jgi:hypothetical protein
MPDKNEPKLVTANDIANLTQAAKRLNDLMGSAIVQKESEAEKAGLAQMIGNFMLDHAFEFIGCWNIVNREYNPLVRGIAALLGRADLYTQNQLAASKPAKQEEAPKLVAP